MPPKYLPIKITFIFILRNTNSDRKIAEVELVLSATAATAVANDDNVTSAAAAAAAVVPPISYYIFHTDKLSYRIASPKNKNQTTCVQFKFVTRNSPSRNNTILCMYFVSFGNSLRRIGSLAKKNNIKI